MNHLFIAGLFSASTPVAEAARPSARQDRLAGPKRAEVDLWRPGPRGQKLYVEVRLPDGQPRMFMVDTGASVSVMSAEAAADLGLEPARKGGELVGLAGRVPWKEVEVPSLELGPYTIPEVKFAVDVPGVPTRAGMVPVDGILGNNVWGQFQLAIDYPANTLELYRPGHMSVPDTARPLHFNGSHARTAAILTVEGAEESREQPIILEVDTGAIGLVIAGPGTGGLRSLATQGVEPIYGIGGADDLPASNFLQETLRLKVVGVEVGGATLGGEHSAKWINHDRSRRPVGPLDMPGLLGHELLDGHRVLLDFPGQRIAVLPPLRAPREQDIHRWALRHKRRVKTTEALQQRAALLAWMDQDGRAMAELERWLRRHPDDHKALVLRARLLRHQGDLNQTLTLLTQLPPEVLVDEHELIATVNGLWLADRDPEALALALDATKARPDRAAAWVALADAHRIAGNLAEARRSLLEANRLDENPDGHLLRRAWISGEEGDLYALLTHVRRLIELYPNGGVAPWFYALHVAGTDEQRLFFDDVARARARLHPGDGPLDFLAMAYRTLGEAEEAQGLMEAGRARDCRRAPEPHSLRNCEAWYRALGGVELDQARALIDEAVAAEPLRSEFLDTLAVVLEAQGDVQGARDAAWRAAALVPDDVYLLWQASRLDAAARATEGG